MNKLLKKSFNAWLIFIKNKVAGAAMMFVSGLMMLIAALNGKGNDTKTLPLLILIAGAAFTFWGFYKIGYLKSDYDKEKNRSEKQNLRNTLIVQVLETLLYFIVAALGVFLLRNENFTDKVLNLIAGGFSILNGIFGVIYIFHHLDNKNFGWKFRIGLTLLEFGMGAFFIINSDSIEVTNYMVLGAITTIAGVIEIFHSITRENLENTIKDGKDMIKAFTDKDADSEDDLPDELTGNEPND